MSKSGGGEEKKKNSDVTNKIYKKPWNYKPHTINSVMDMI